MRRMTGFGTLVSRCHVDVWLDGSHLVCQADVLRSPRGISESLQ